MSMLIACIQVILLHVLYIYLLEVFLKLLSGHLPLVMELGVVEHLARGEFGDASYRGEVHKLPPKGKQVNRYLLRGTVQG